MRYHLPPKLMQMASVELWSDVMFATQNAVDRETQPIRSANEHIGLLFVLFMVRRAIGENRSSMVHLFAICAVHGAVCHWRKQERHGRLACYLCCSWCGVPLEKIGAAWYICLLFVLFMVRCAIGENRSGMVDWPAICAVHGAACHWRK